MTPLDIIVIAGFGIAALIIIAAAVGWSIARRAMRRLDAFEDKWL
jgi:hypothetical protein